MGNGSTARFTKRTWNASGRQTRRTGKGRSRNLRRNTDSVSGSIARECAPSSTSGCRRSARKRDVVFPQKSNANHFQAEGSFCCGCLPQPPTGGGRILLASVMKSENVPHWRVPAVVGLICLALFGAGTGFLEYEMLLLSGAAFVVFTAACALAVISGALCCAPEGDERADGLHLRQRHPAEVQETNLRSFPSILKVIERKQ